MGWFLACFWVDGVPGAVWFVEGLGSVVWVLSRCGVFAKTDIQALMNDGAEKADIALSVFQAVVNQTIGNLAQGRPIGGNVAFLGGPLHFLPELKKRFIETRTEVRKRTVEKIVFRKKKIGAGNEFAHAVCFGKRGKTACVIVVRVTYDGALHVVERNVHQSRVFGKDARRARVE